LPFPETEYSLLQSQENTEREDTRISVLSIGVFLGNLFSHFFNLRLLLLATD